MAWSDYRPLPAYASTSGLRTRTVHISGWESVPAPHYDAPAFLSAAGYTTAPRYEVLQAAADCIRLQGPEPAVQ
jgi:hypothetical protein